MTQPRSRRPAAPGVPEWLRGPGGRRGTGGQPARVGHRTPTAGRGWGGGRVRRGGGRGPHRAEAGARTQGRSGPRTGTEGPGPGEGPGIAGGDGPGASGGGSGSGRAARRGRDAGAGGAGDPTGPGGIRRGKGSRLLTRDSVGTPSGSARVAPRAGAWHPGSRKACDAYRNRQRKPRPAARAAGGSGIARLRRAGADDEGSRRH